MAEYRIDDLARAAGTTVRNVRVYQDRELLPPPRRQGRTAIYSDAHLVRLRLIINMLERGYAFAQIKEMISAWESGRSLGDVLGLEEVVGESWAEEAPRAVTATELRRMFGKQFSPGNVKRAMELGLLERRGRGFVSQSPQLLDAGAELVSLGVPLGEVLDLAEQLQQDIDHVAGHLVEMVRRHVLTRPVPSEEEVPYYSDVLQRLRPLVMSALNAAAARSAARVIPEVLGDRLIEMVAGSEEHAKRA
ncbi:MerR family transcriptional regulator [Saccharopolyspora indica]|uniref:MerR family transcriptional regulator n=1 Tax=Saccharopolyspora TaxID=1835 RepID=UPI000A3F61E7|nr:MULTISPECIES: MerR family transcriptional regulator [Saccharopolyspora]MDA3648829.1 MerR family transcriptional regulator [Saccharopolyspora indica]